MSEDTVDRNDVLARTERFIREQLTDEGSGHDWWHVWRVRRTAREIGQDERVDLFVVDLAALLHDIDDWKLNGGDELAGPRKAAAWLRGLGVEEEVVEHVAGIIATTSFKGAAIATPMATREGMVVQDADRLDAMGAIGIARAFTFGGYVHQILHDPGIPRQLHESAASYNARTGTTINHFDEKLLLLRDRMNTELGRRIAAERHAFMERYLERFLAEWDGRA